MEIPVWLDFVINWQGNMSLGVSQYLQLDANMAFMLPILENREWWQRVADGSYQLERIGTGD